MKRTESYISENHLVASISKYGLSRPYVGDLILPFDVCISGEDAHHCCSE